MMKREAWMDKKKNMSHGPTYYYAKGTFPYYYAKGTFLILSISTHTNKVAIEVLHSSSFPGFAGCHAATRLKNLVKVICAPSPTPV